MVEVNNTCIGTKYKKLDGTRGWARKNDMVSRMERDGKVRGQHVSHVTAEKLRPVLMDQIHAKSNLMTDEAFVYKKLGKEFSSHGYAMHSIGEYVHGDTHTNRIKDVYQHCSS